MVFESLLTISRPRTVTTSLRAEASDVVATTVSLVGSSDAVYDEEAFHHFLAIERMRAARSEQPFLLLLVSLRNSPNAGTGMSRSVSAGVLSVLGQCVREIDFIGWYRADRIAGAVLAQGFDTPGPGALTTIVHRVTNMLSAELPAHIAGRLRVRVVRLGRASNS
jgi:hypothetical protein